MKIPKAVIETNEQIKDVLKEWTLGENEELRRLLVRCRAAIGWLIDHLEAAEIVEKANADG